MKSLELNIPIEEFGKLSKWKAKTLLRKKTSKAALKYLLEEKEKQIKLASLEYDKLEIQEYLVQENRNTEVSKIIFKARSLTLDIKLHKKWKYHDKICMGCGVKEENGDELLHCDGFGDGKTDFKQISYSVVFNGSASEMADIGQELRKRLKIQKKISEGQN